MDIDRVAMVSLRADGTPDQGEGYEVIGDERPPVESATQARQKRRAKAKP